MSDLFRREAIEHATQRLEGQVFLASPLSLKTLGLLLSGIVFAAAIFAATATYARKTTVTGFLVPDQGMIRITSQAQGTLRSVLVKEGDTVEKGTRLAILDVSTSTATGNTGEALLKGFQSESLAAKSRAESKLALLQLERDQAKVRSSKSESELAQVDQQIELQQERLKLARDEVDRGEAIAAKGYMPKREVDQRRLASLAIEQDLAGARRQKATAERELAGHQGAAGFDPVGDRSRSLRRRCRPGDTRAAPRRIGIAASAIFRRANHRTGRRAARQRRPSCRGRWHRRGDHPLGQPDRS